MVLMPARRLSRGDGAVRGEGEVIANGLKNVVGILYKVPMNVALDRLDIFEGVKSEQYHRRPIRVYPISSSSNSSSSSSSSFSLPQSIAPIDAMTYLAYGSSCSDVGLLPTDEYLNHLLAGSDLLPAEYVKRLKSIQ